MTNRITRRTSTLTALMLSLALSSTACGQFGGGDTDTGASVSVGGVESGCADAINLSRLLNGGSFPSITTADLQQFANGASSLEENFSDSRVDEYISLVDEVIGKAAESAESQDNPSPGQLMLLVEFEKVGREADFERLTPAADDYFVEQCGSEYTAALVDADPVDTPTSDTPTPDAPAEAAAEEPAVAEPAAGEDDTADEPAAPEIIRVVEDTSVGANGVFLRTEIEVGEIIRTNLTPNAALNDGTDLGEGEIIMVGIRLTNPGFNAFSSLSDYSWAAADGTKEAAVGSVSSTGGDWNARVGLNESKRGYLIFSAELGPTEGAYLEVGTGNLVAERIPLGVGDTSSTYPIAIASGQVADAVFMNNSSVCEYASVVEVRDANITLDALKGTGHEHFRPANNERFITLDVGIKVDSVTGQNCDWSTRVYGGLTEVRLRLDNGDVVQPTNDDFGAEVGATSTARWSFPVTTEVSSFDLVINGGDVLSWTDIAFPEA